MKYLLVFAVLFVAIWLWRKSRRDEMRSRPPARPATPAVEAPQDMLRCAHCGLHLPAADAIAGPNGIYCCAAHRQAAGR
ncbi:MAG: PP0621 family protein [Variovorax sp.]